MHAALVDESSPHSWTTANLELAVRGYFGSQSDDGTRRVLWKSASRRHRRTSNWPGRNRTRSDSCAHPWRVEARTSSAQRPGSWRPSTALRRTARALALGARSPSRCSAAAAKALADLLRYVIANGGDDAEPNSTTPEALATRVALVDEFERLAAAFAVGDKVVVEGRRKPSTTARPQSSAAASTRADASRSPSRCATAPRRSRVKLARRRGVPTIHMSGN